jgi:hypothetical protein
LKLELDSPCVVTKITHTHTHTQHMLYINSLGLSVCLFELVHFDPLTVSARPILQPPRWQKRGPEMSRTWPEMFQHQVRVVVAERHTLVGSSVSPHQPLIASSRTDWVLGDTLSQCRNGGIHKQDTLSQCRNEGIHKQDTLSQCRNEGIHKQDTLSQCRNGGIHKQLQECTFVSILQLGIQKGTSIGGMPQSSKTIVGGPINMAPLK